MSHHGASQGTPASSGDCGAPSRPYPDWAPRGCCFPIEDTQQLRDAGRLTTSDKPDAAGAYCCVYFGVYTDANGKPHSIAAKKIGEKHSPDYLRRDLDAANRVQGSQYVAPYLVVTTRRKTDAAGGDVEVPEYFIMTREGQSLEQWMTEGHWPMASQASEERQANRAAFEKYLWCVLQGLNDLHDAGMVHRDVKPDNCIIATADSSMAKLIDLGIARSNFDRGVLNAVALSGTNDLHRAPEYTSPDTATMSADVWAVGAMAAEWLFMETHPKGGKSAWDAFANPKSRCATIKDLVSGRGMASGDRLAQLAMETLHDDPMQRPIASEAALILGCDATSTHDHVAVVRADVVLGRIGAAIHDLVTRYSSVLQDTPLSDANAPATLTAAELYSCYETILNAVERLDAEVNRKTRQAILRTVRQHLTSITHLRHAHTDETDADTTGMIFMLRARCHDLSRGTRNLQAAIALYDRLIDIHTAAHGMGHAQLTKPLYNKATALQAMGGSANLTAAIDLYDRVIAIETAAYGADHAEVAKTLNSKAKTLLMIGGTANFTTAIELCDQAIANYTAAHGAAHGADHAQLAKTFKTKAIALRAMRGAANLTAALDLNDRVIEIYTAAYGADHVLVAETLNNKALVLRDIGGAANLTTAIELYDRVFKIETAAYGEDHVQVVKALCNKALTLRDIGGAANLTTAIELYDRAIKIETVTYGADHVEVAGTLNIKAIALQAMGGTENVRKALALCDQAIAIYTAVNDAIPVHVAMTLNTKANALVAMGGTENLREAIALYDRVIEIYTVAYGANHVQVAMTLNTKAKARRSMVC